MAGVNAALNFWTSADSRRRIQLVVEPSSDVVHGEPPGVTQPASLHRALNLVKAFPERQWTLVHDLGRRCVRAVEYGRVGRASLNAGGLSHQVLVDPVLDLARELGRRSDELSFVDAQHDLTEDRQGRAPAGFFVPEGAAVVESDPDGDRDPPR